MMMGVALVFAMLFILRGLNLGIPYVSPKIAQVQTEAPVCH
jgi:Na+-transporting methylmalonyl-CoA/oxaloacetate decarboxylase gamma subunit